MKEDSDNAAETPKPSSPPAKAVPKSWADLVRSKAPAPAATPVVAPEPDGVQLNGAQPTKGISLADVLNKFTVRANDSDGKIAFTKPRGLVNTGNMCYMNSVCDLEYPHGPTKRKLIPGRFFKFFYIVYHFTTFSTMSANMRPTASKARHQWSMLCMTNTPPLKYPSLTFHRILFIREFPIIDAATTVEQLRMRLKDNELEEYGESFTPEFVYDAIRRLSRFSSMRVGPFKLSKAGLEANLP